VIDLCATVLVGCWNFIVVVLLVVEIFVHTYQSTFCYPFLKVLVARVEGLVCINCHTDVSPLADCQQYYASQVIQYLLSWIWVMVSSLKKCMPLVIVGCVFPIEVIVSLHTW
jgi:hypothetical protein